MTSALEAPLTRPPARFPGPQAPSADDAPSPTAVLWLGGPGFLRESARDHALAAGMHLLDAATHGADTAGAGIALLTADVLAEGPEPSTDTDGPLRALLLTDEELSPEQWERALALGARQVLRLPQDSLRLLDLLRAAGARRSRSRVVVVTGGHGGAGASSFAARLAGASTRSPVLIDADPFGGGLDLLVQAPPLRGSTWSEIEGLDDGAGHVILDSLPEIDGVRLLVAGTDPSTPSADALRSTVLALRGTGADLIIDCAPHFVGELTQIADDVLVVTTGSDHALSATARRLALWSERSARFSLVVRSVGDSAPSALSRELGVPLAASFRSSGRGLVPLLDRRRTGADRAARTLMDAWEAQG